MPASLSETLFTGARAVLEVNGVKVGHMTNVSASRTFQNAILEACGSPIAEALPTVGIGVDLSADFARVIGPADDARAKGLVPGSKPEDIILFPLMDALIYDGVTNQLIGKVIGCKPSNEGIIQTGARSWAAANLRWQALNFQHASELS
jgi:hypothetical protein